MRARRLLYPAAFAFVFILIVVVVICWFDTTTTLVLVRHADRLDSSPNTNLSAAGLTRAQALAEVAGEAGVVALFTTDFCRTAQTAQPLADLLALPLNVQQSNNPAAGLGTCDPAITVPVNGLSAQINSVADLVDHILNQHAGQVVLVVGHSDTVPLMVETLGDGAFSPIEIGSAEYDRLFIVTVPRFFGNPTIVKATYGD